jgi:hypothetical protein
MNIKPEAFQIYYCLDSILYTCSRFEQFYQLKQVKKEQKQLYI